MKTVGVNDSDNERVVSESDMKNSKAKSLALLLLFLFSRPCVLAISNCSFADCLYLFQRAVNWTSSMITAVPRMDITPAFQQKVENVIHLTTCLCLCVSLLLCTQGHSWENKWVARDGGVDSGQRQRSFELLAAARQTADSVFLWVRRWYFSSDAVQ